MGNGHLLPLHLCKLNHETIKIVVHVLFVKSGCRDTKEIPSVP